MREIITSVWKPPPPPPKRLLGRYPDRTPSEGSYRARRVAHVRYGGGAGRRPGEEHCRKLHSHTRTLPPIRRIITTNVRTLLYIKIYIHINTLALNCRETNGIVNVSPVERSGRQFTRRIFKRTSNGWLTRESECRGVKVYTTRGCIRLHTCTHTREYYYVLRFRRRRHRR